MGKRENNGFTCEHCSREVIPVTNGSYRNHCPFCLYSKHLDILPGDRRCTCNGLMKPVGLHYNANKGYQIVHKCMTCGYRTVNKVAEFTVQPDDMDKLIELVQ
jgi:hypothetical protein